MRFDGKQTKRRITKFKLSELSAVPKGAQAPAKMAIMKISADNLRAQLETALRTKFPKPPEMEYGNIWVADHDESTVVFCGYDDKHYALPYVMSGTQILLGDEPLQVTRQGSYQATNGQSFFKSATDAYHATLLESAGFDAEQAAVLKTALVADVPVEDQVATLCTQFGKAVTASVGGKAHPAADFAYVPDAEKPSTWKLPIFDASHASAAVAALGEGYRGKKVSIPDEERGKVLQNVRNAYREHFPDKELPDVLKKSGDSNMSEKTPEQLQKELDTVNARVANLEVLAKMSDAEKAHMATMSDADKEKWMAMSAEDRAAKIKTQKADDESFVSAVDGQTIAKSQVGDLAYGFMKAQHEELVKIRERESIREAEELVKSLCPDLPGTDAEKAGALRKCKFAMTVEQFGVLEKALKAGNEAMKGRMVAKAHQQNVSDTSTAQQAYDDGIAKIMSEKKVTKSQAMSSAEGTKLAKALREAQAQENE